MTDTDHRWQQQGWSRHQVCSRCGALHTGNVSDVCPGVPGDPVEEDGRMFTSDRYSMGCEDCGRASCPGGCGGNEPKPTRWQDGSY